MRTTVACVFLLLVAAPAISNPVPRSTIDRLNALPGLVADAPGSAPLRTELRDMLGWYGFVFMGQDSRSVIARRFDLFADILIDSQRPGYEVDEVLQEFYWAHADNARREAMAKALYAWLGARLTKVPRSGSMQIIGGSGMMIREAAIREGVKAARVLSMRQHPLGQAMVSALWDTCTTDPWIRSNSCAEIAELAARQKKFAPSARVRFDKEEVRIHIEGEMLVEGTYSFSRIGGAGYVPLWYPFPGTTRPRVFSVRVMNDGLWEDIPFSQSVGGLNILLPLWHPEVQLRVHYSQGIQGKKAEYVLTTTALWEKPIGEARFTVYVPSRDTPTFSLPLKKTGEEDAWSRYELEARVFQPDRDLVITW